MHISYKPLWHTLGRICETLNCGILDVELTYVKREE